MLAYAILLIALITTGLATTFYCKAYVSASAKQAASNEKTATIFYNAAACAVFIASGYLLYFFLSDNFRYLYVFSYSARAQELAYKISAFWAGQEGSFLLWALFHAGFGLLLTRKKAPAAMTAYGALQFLLLVILAVKSPFRPMPIPEADGIGMNPLLQDPWMVVHPPIIFLGYAALAVPFAWSIHGLLTGRHKEVILHSMPWTLFAWSSLGAGIFIGGYWAYKVLGWGGYWAWDPVENSSLIPWLITGALIHLLILARVRDTAIKYVYVSAIINFVLVVYGTYLTRSGVLNNFSTHAFNDQGIGSLLGNILFTIAAGGFAVLIWHWSKLPDGRLYLQVKSREFCLCAAAMLLIGIGIVVFAGTSTPLFTTFMGNPASVSLYFYNAASLPLIAAMAMLLSGGSLLTWGANSALKLRRYWWFGVIALIPVSIAFVFGIHNLFALVTVGAATAAFAATLTAFRNKLLSWPAGLTHIGLSVALTGIVFSSLSTQSVTTTFELGARQQVLGQQITYMGKHSDITKNAFYHQFKLDNPVSALLLPYTKLNKAGDPAVHEPGIYRGLTADIYLTPILQSDETKELINLHKGEKLTLEELEITFIRFTMNSGTNGDIKAAAIFEVSKNGIIEDIKPELISQRDQLIRVPATAFNNYEITLRSLNIKDGIAGINMRDLTLKTKPETLEVQISRKPLMILVWLGSILVTLGTAWAALKRSNNNCFLSTGTNNIEKQMPTKEV